MGLRLAGRHMGFRVACMVLSCGTAHSFAIAAGEGGNEPVPEGGGPCAALNGPICVGADSACQFSDLQDAIDSVSESSGENTTIHVADNQEYEDQVLFIFNRNLTLRGGFSSCAAFSPSGRTALHGTATHSVISIGADAGHRTVHLESLEIRDGGGTDPVGFHTHSIGGGVGIGGNVDVTITGSMVSDNSATFGGGIALGGEDGAELTLVDTWIIDNAAANGVNGAAHSSGNGGGIFCVDGGTVTIEGGMIRSNEAVADKNGATAGGGAYLGGCGFSATGTEVMFNVSQTGDGGGIFLGSGGELILSGSSAGPLLLGNNIAGRSGGGVFTTSPAILDGVAVEDNVAGYSGTGGGGGIYTASSSLIIDSSTCIGCSTLRDNTAATAGSAIYADHFGQPVVVTIRNTRIAGNGDQTDIPVLQVDSGGNLPSSIAQLHMANDLVAFNYGSSVASIVSNTQGYIQVSTSTVVGNSVGNNGVDDLFINRNDQEPQNPPPVTLLNSILFEAPGVPAVAMPTIDDRVDCLIAYEGSGLPPAAILIADPRFTDVKEEDFHLQADSPAIDFCRFANDGPDLDLDGNPRGVDAPQVPPYVPDATYDLGAYEWQPGITDRIFADGFDS